MLPEPDAARALRTTLTALATHSLTYWAILCCSAMSPWPMLASMVAQAGKTTAWLMTLVTLHLYAAPQRDMAEPLTSLLLDNGTHDSWQSCKLRQPEGPVRRLDI